MEQNLVTQLKKLSAIEPDREFVARSRGHFMVQRKVHATLAAPSVTGARTFSFPFVFPQMKLAGAFAFLGLLVFLLTPFIFQTPQLSALSADAINREYDNMSINIQLNEISFDQNAHQTIATAITEITDMKTKHLSSQILESEVKDITTVSDEVDQVDAMLNQIIN
ncbi:MAG: hypothetical protein Q7R98_01275 [Candidatus Jorgensenbacteria bacterium]|nr:hypothetical protein [Candidatus Jorgensenbacteria bacterium]